MLGKFIARRVRRTWTEEFIDRTTGDITSIEREAIEFEPGMYIDAKVLSSIRFWQTEGSIREIEVTNQKRLAMPTENTLLFPHKARVEIGKKKHTFLFYSTGLKNGMDLLTDYLELNYSGLFTITRIEEMEDCIVLTDTLSALPELSAKAIEALILGKSDEEKGEPSATVEDDDEEKAKSQRRFYQLNVKIVEVDKSGKEPDENRGGLFIVETYSAVRANLIITKWLNDQQEERRLAAAMHPERTFVEREISSYIEESKLLSIGEFIPREFSEAYCDGEDQAQGE